MKDSYGFKGTCVSNCLYFFRNGECIEEIIRLSFYLFEEPTNRSRQTVKTPQLAQMIERTRPYAPATAIAGSRDNVLCTRFGSRLHHLPMIHPHSVRTAIGATTVSDNTTAMCARSSTHRRSSLGHRGATLADTARRCRSTMGTAREHRKTSTAAKTNPPAEELQNDAPKI